MTGGRPAVIERVSWQSFSVPFAQAFQTSRTALAMREGFFVTVETSAAQGLGEASPLPEFGGGTLEEVGHALELFASQLVGWTLDDAWRAESFTRNVSAGSPAVARAGLETAIADAAARLGGMPVWAWLASREGISVESNPVIPVNAIIDAGTPEAVALAVRKAVAAGFRTVKLKVGTDSGADLERIAAVREAGGADLDIRIDANGAWNDDAAVTLLTRCGEYRVALCEQPLDPRREDVFGATARLRERVPVPIALDESIRTVGDLNKALETQAADAIVVKPMLTGLREALGVFRACRSADLPAIVTTTFDTAVGTAMALSLASLLPEPRLACGLATLERLEASLGTGVPPCCDGSIVLGSEPGLGVVVDEAALRRYGGAISGSVGR